VKKNSIKHKIVVKILVNANNKGCPALHWGFFETARYTAWTNATKNCFQVLLIIGKKNFVKKTKKTKTRKFIIFNALFGIRVALSSNGIQNILPGLMFKLSFGVAHSLILLHLVISALDKMLKCRQNHGILVCLLFSVKEPTRST
jgi:hypothetical protein